MGFDDAACAFALGDVHHDRPSVRAAELGAYRHTPGPTQPKRYVHHQHMIITGIVVDDQVAECVRVEPRAMPRIEPVGDHILRLADAGLGDHSAD
jgi:hypothetical protein